MSDILDAIGEATGRCPHCGQQVPAQPGHPEPALRVRFPAEWRDEDIARFKEAFLSAVHRPPSSTIVGPGPYEPGTVLCVDTGTSTEQVVTGRSAGAVTEVYPSRPPWWRRLLNRITPRRRR